MPTTAGSTAKPLAPRALNRHDFTHQRVERAPALWRGGSSERLLVTWAPALNFEVRVARWGAIRRIWTQCLRMRCPANSCPRHSCST
jgi:hypothetical protein